MNLLLLDTSTKSFSLAVSRDEKVLAYRNVRPGKVLSSSIMPAIARIIKKAGLTLAKIDGFAVGLGPGSFTSLRVGLATVKGLAFVSGKSVVGISSLDVLAAGVGDDARQVCVLCDAKRSLVYACLYEKKGEALKKKSKYLLTDVKNVLKLIKGEVTFAGDGVPLFRSMIERTAGMKAFFGGEKQMYPQAQYMPSLVLPRFRCGKTDDNDSLVPLYLYPQDCQVRRT